MVLPQMIWLKIEIFSVSVSQSQNRGCIYFWSLDKMTCAANVMFDIWNFLMRHCSVTDWNLSLDPIKIWGLIKKSLRPVIELQWIFATANSLIQTILFQRTTRIHDQKISCVQKIWSKRFWTVEKSKFLIKLCNFDNR